MRQKIHKTTAILITIAIMAALSGCGNDYIRITAIRSSASNPDFEVRMRNVAINYAYTTETDTEYIISIHLTKKGGD